MTRPLVPWIFVLLLAALPLSAQNSDLGISLTPASPTVLTGERLDLTLTAFNHGPDATFVNVYALLSTQQQIVNVTAPPGWTCAPPSTVVVNCSVSDKFPANAEAVF